jgi:hypothetical protein
MVMIRVSKTLDGHYRLSGFETEEARDEKIAHLREAFEIGYGFGVPSMGHSDVEGYWFTYWRGESCD